MHPAFPRQSNRKRGSEPVSRRPRSGFTVPALVLALGAAARGAEGDAYITRIDTIEDFERVSIPERSLPGVDRITKFLAPARADAELLPTLFQDVNRYRLHQEFLAGEFRDRFPGLGGEEYLALVERRATRSYFAGVIFRFKTEAAPRYGFDVFTASGVDDELPSEDDARWIHRQLTPVFALGVLAYAPRSAGAILKARQWSAPDFPIDFSFSDAGDSSYFAYTAASNYGRVRVFTEAEFAAANQSGGFGSQDIVVLEEAPADIEGVIAGVITGSIQSELGHLAIRTARRGTPNAYVRDAVRTFAPYNGKLVFLEVGVESFEVADNAVLAEAEAWWAAHRPDLSESFPEADIEYRSFDAAGEAALDGPARPVARYGGKGANFLRLFTLLPEPNRVPGFVVPFRYYAEFLEQNRARSRLDPEREVTFAEHIRELLEDPDFKGDSARRFVELARLREILEAGDVEPALVRSIALKVVRVFGASKLPVRLRSSSNAEDQLEFNGAGLYSSVSACAADDLDAGDGGPSQCDAAEADEEGIARALKRVWASLWNFRAYEERDYFQIPHQKARMAVLVSEAFRDERANGVAFTGNPSVRGDRRFLINSQLGDVPVVFTDPGVTAEKSVLEMRDGQAASISRVRPSSLVPPGGQVLSDENLRELGGLMALVEAGYPIDRGAHAPDEVLLDFEFKLDRNSGRMRLKQVRPFLIPDGGGGEPLEFRLVVPGGLAACSSFLEGRPNREVLRSKARLGLKSGAAAVRSDGSSPAELFEWIELDPGGARIPPLGPGLWTAERVESPAPGYRFAASQEFRAGDAIVRAALKGLFVAESGAREVVLDAPALTWGTSERFLHLEYEVAAAGADAARGSWLLPCDVGHLPRVKVDVELSSGDRLRFEEQFQELTVGTGPAELVHARVRLGGREQVVEDYWRLVYSAGHHNDTPYPELWAVLDPPIDLAGIGRVKVAAVAQNFKGQEPEAFYLGEDFEVLHRPEIVLFRRQRLDAEEVPQFRRGDSDASGKINVADAVGVLLHLFKGGALACPDAADVDDIGNVELGDAVLLLYYLFLSLDPPAAPGPRRCGEDPTPDALPACDGAACRS
jgi:hypothetical protein